MPTFTSEILRSRALPALHPLFEALAAERATNEAWVNEVLHEEPEIGEAGLDGALRAAFVDKLYTVAACIIMVGDDIVRACAIAYLVEDSKPKTRWLFGRLFGQHRVGAILQAGANAFRHSAEWKAGKPTAEGKKAMEVLTSLGVQLDESASHAILTKLGLNTADDFINEIDAICIEMEQAARCECGHPAGGCMSLWPCHIFGSMIMHTSGGGRSWRLRENRPP
jgi:hypothetical protein